MYEVPNFGKMLFITLLCNDCGYRHNDVVSLEASEPLRYELVVEGVEDLNTRVIRSSSARIRIPELGVVVEPGPQAEGFISNVEGVLERIERASSALRDEKLSRYQQFLEKIMAAKRGKLRFRLILEDPYGCSAIVSPKAKRRKLSSRELSKLLRRG